MMLAPVTVNLILYGNWTLASPAVQIIGDLLKNAGGSPYELVNASYYDGAKAHISGGVQLGMVVFDNYSLGKSLSDSDVWTVVTSHIGKELLSDPKALYFVITANDVAGTSGLFNQYCGWHNSSTLSGVSIKFALIGDPYPNNMSGCAEQLVGPNGSNGGDAMASVILHELNEATSDPEGNAWYFARTGNENEDQCAWTFGLTYRAANGALANMKFGTRDYLIQQNWRAVVGPCALK